MASTPRPAHTRKSASGKLAQIVRIGTHAITSDEPAALGGDDLGPDPHELLDAALASCTALTLTLYAQHKGLAIENLEVAVSHTEADGVYRIERTIHVEGALTDAQRARLLEIANRCPVHRTLSGRFEIASELEPGSIDAHPDSSS